MAVDMFLKIGDLKGEAKGAKFEGMIDVLAWNWGMAQSANMHSGSAGGGGGGRADVHDLTLTKWIDKATPNLMLGLCKGKIFPEAVLTVRRPGGEQQPYLTITMTNVLVKSLITGGSGGDDRLTENMTLNFEKFKVEYKEQKDDRSAGASTEAAWDIAKAAAA